MAIIAPPHSHGARLCGVWRDIYLGRYPLALVDRFRAAYGIGRGSDSSFLARHGHYHVFPTSNLTLGEHLRKIPDCPPERARFTSTNQDIVADGEHEARRPQCIELDIPAILFVPECGNEAW